MLQPMGSDQIRDALHRGALSIPDEHGFHHGIMARCPLDGRNAHAHRTERTRDGISRVVFRCPSCMTEFDAAPEQMYIRN
jgi:hypothetical protein